LQARKAKVFERIFPKGIPMTKTFYRDLGRAGIERATPEGVIDVHALRVTHGSFLALSGSKGSRAAWGLIAAASATAAPTSPGTIQEIVADLRKQAEVNVKRCDEFVELMKDGETTKEQHEAFVDAMSFAWEYQLLRIDHLISVWLASREKREGP
jgi:hypothetical protein